MSPMPRSRVIAAAICLGIITAGLVYVFLSKQTKQANAPVQVITAKRNIAKQTVIDVGMLKMQTLPGDTLPASVARVPEAVVGMVALSPIREGQPIAMSDLGEAHRMAYKVPSFMRAVTVALDPIIGVGGFIRPGDHVDVIATFTANEGTVTKTVLQDVELLAAGGEVVAAAQPETGKQGTAETVPNATLSVSPKDAEKLILAESRGKLRLALRGADDTSYIVSKGTTSRAVMGPVPPDVPEKVERASVPSHSTPMGGNMMGSSRIAPVGPIQPVGPLPPIETGKKIQIVRGTKLEEILVPD